MVLLQEPGLVRRAILAGTAPRGGEGIDKITKIAAVAYLKAYLTFKDPRYYSFFQRTPEGKQAAKEYFARLKERKTGRGKRISIQGKIAHLKAIRAAGKHASDDLSVITQPVFVANGDHDLMVDSKQASSMAQRLPNARLTLYPNSGHGGVFQNHRTFVPAALAFLNEPDASRQMAL